MIKKSDLLERVDYVIRKGEMVNGSGAVAGFRASGLSVISSIVGENHTYYKEFRRKTDGQMDFHIDSGIHILDALKDEIEHDWLVSIKQLVTAEVFSDFLDMSKHLLDQKYKDPAAVMIGSVLEQHLRLLCNTHRVDDFVIKGGDNVPKKADLMNVDLVKAGVYQLTYQKLITAWLGLRNSAAHGKYEDYNLGQIQNMYDGVSLFIASVN